MTVTLKTIEEARETLQGVAKKTPLIESPVLGSKVGGEVFFKYENLQKTGSFKIRGAVNKIAHLTPEEAKRGVIAASAGNHAQGVALGATAKGIKATIVMPATTPLAKVSATKGYGGNVILEGAAFDEAYAKALKVQKETNAVFVHPFDDEYVIAGQGTIALEILEDLPDVDMVVVPVGGGGMISGIASGLKLSNPKIKVVGVESAAVPSMKESIDAGKIVTVPAGVTAAEGINVRTPGNITFEMVKKYVDEIVTVTEDEIAEAMLYLIEKGKNLAEGAGATPLAAVLAGKIDCKGKKVVLMVSGGNADITFINRIINKALLLEGRRAEFKIIMEDRCGETAKLLKLISDNNANILFITQSMYESTLEVESQIMTLVLECSDMDHRNLIAKKITEAGYRLVK
ncbi:MAG: threonine ammonia-lyase [Acidaminococcaceae bacterium]|jgi:threonine dehydratase|nr:threonine ammonia-lyase [Acidaminococcaceae bacterium]MCI2110294.1 threonine ammonia-lyase [Acidaminococcaceae bacterium]